MGWLEDGSPLVVDGLAPSRTGDEGIWFLVDGGDPDLGAFVVQSAQGRYLASPGQAREVDGSGPLVAALAARPIAELASDVERLAR